jgi:hypothetical protein
MARWRTSNASRAMFRHLDVTSEAEWKAAVDATIAEFGKLDILVNDAGPSGSAVENLFDTAAWDRLIVGQCARRLSRDEIRDPAVEGGRRRLDRQHLVDFRHHRTAPCPHRLQRIKGGGPHLDQGAGLLHRPASSTRAACGQSRPPPAYRSRSRRLPAAASNPSSTRSGSGCRRSDRRSRCAGPLCR